MFYPPTQYDSQMACLNEIIILHYDQPQVHTVGKKTLVATEITARTPQ